MALTEREYEVLTFMEMEYSLSGYFPSEALILERVGCSKKFLLSAVAKPDFKRALIARGMREDSKPGGIITTEQMVCVNTLLDKSDTRSKKKKLNDLGIPSQTYMGWCSDPAFQAYTAARCEALFPNMLNEAHSALYDNVARGDMTAIKLVYEMTGRYSEKKASEVNIDFLLMKVLETIQKHVTDPRALSAISEDLLSLTSQGPTQTPTQASTQVSPSVARLPVIIDAEMPTTGHQPPMQPLVARPLVSVPDHADAEL